MCRFGNDYILCVSQRCLSKQTPLCDNILRKSSEICFPVTGEGASDPKKQPFHIKLRVDFILITTSYVHFTVTFLKMYSAVNPLSIFSKFSHATMAKIP